MKRVRALVLLLLSVFVLSGCGADYDEESQYVPSTNSSSNLTDRLESNTDTSQSESMTQPSESEILSKEHESVNIQITVGDTTFTAIPEENSSADALIALLEKGRSPYTCLITQEWKKSVHWGPVCRETIPISASTPAM